MLKPQIKILDQIKILNPNIRLIAFKAEYISDAKEIIQGAFSRLKESHADAIIANNVSKKDRGFESDNNEVFMILPDGAAKHLQLTSKRKIAEKVVDYISSKYF